MGSDSKRRRLKNEKRLQAQRLESERSSKPGSTQDEQALTGKSDSSIRVDQELIQAVVSPTNSDQAPSTQEQDSSNKHNFSFLLMSVTELAYKLTLSRSTVDRWAKKGQIPGRIVLGGQVRYHMPTIEAWLAELAKSPKDKPT